MLLCTGFKTCAITNNWIDDTVTQTNRLASMHLSHMFDLVLESCRTGLRKPDVRIYQLACQKLGVTPGEVS